MDKVSVVISPCWDILHKSAALPVGDSTSSARAMDVSENIMAIIKKNFMATILPFVNLFESAIE
jgi:hypothetical protein